MKTLRSGYITSAGMDGGRLRLTIDDSYEDDALHLDIWLGRTIAGRRRDSLQRTAHSVIEGHKF